MPPRSWTSNRPSSSTPTRSPSAQRSASPGVADSCRSRSGRSRAGTTSRTRWPSRRRRRAGPGLRAPAVVSPQRRYRRLPARSHSPDDPREQRQHREQTEDQLPTAGEVHRRTVAPTAGRGSGPAGPARRPRRRGARGGVPGSTARPGAVAPASARPSAVACRIASCVSREGRRSPGPRCSTSGATAPDGPRGSRSAPGSRLSAASYEAHRPATRDPCVTSTSGGTTSAHSWPSCSASPPSCSAAWTTHRGLQLIGLLLAVGGVVLGVRIQRRSSTGNAGRGSVALTLAAEGLVTLP